MKSTADLFDLSGETALVTGSSKGIGFALARGLAGAGARVVLNGRDAAALDKATKTLRGEGADVSALPFDVTDHGACAKAIDGYEDAEGPISILVNNAGMQHRGPLEEFAAADFERLIATNVSSVFNVGQAAARRMIGRGRGKIINIASVNALLARPGITPYVGSKGAVVNLTKGMATEWAGKGLNVNAIAPGYFETELTEALVKDEEFTAWLTKRTPAGRWGKVEELVGACVFLASPSASFMNGHTLFVDGGITASL